MTKLHKVLFVDDDLSILKAANLFFRNKYNVVLSTNGKDAIGKIASEHVDVIVSDYSMLNGNGLELKKYIDKADYEIPFILMSGQITKGNVIEFANAKVDYIFEKPFDFEDLNLQIETSLENKRKNQEKNKLSFLGKNTGHIIHDINNNLGIIMMGSELGLGMVPDEAMGKILTKTQKACSNIIDMVDKYKVMNNFNLNLAPITVAEFLQNMESSCQEYSQVYGVNFSLSHSGIRGKLEVDEDLMKQLVLNLLSNSKDSMVDSVKEVKIECSMDHKYLYLIVSDNGTGICPKVQPKLFKEKVSTKGDKGTGMGLGYCKQIVDSHLGEISLHKSDSQGTSFLIKLPYIKGENP